MMINTPDYKTVRAVGCRNPLSHARLTRLNQEQWFMDTLYHDPGFITMGTFNGIVSLEKDGIWPQFGHIEYSEGIIYRGGVAMLKTTPNMIVPHGPDGIFFFRGREMKGQWQMGFLVKVDGYKGNVQVHKEMVNTMRWLYQRSDEEKNLDPLWPFPMNSDKHFLADLGVAVEGMEVLPETWDTVLGKSSAPNTPQRVPRDGGFSKKRRL